MKKDILSKQELFLVFVLFIIIFQSVFTTWVSDAFSYSDEIVALLGFYVLVTRRNLCILKSQSKYLTIWRNCLFVILAIGVISSLNSRLQPFGAIWFNEIFTFLKAFLVLVYCVYLSSKCNISRTIQFLSFIIFIYLALSLLFCVVNLLVDNPATHDDEELRFGIRNFRFFHHDAGDYASVLITILAFLHVKGAYQNKPSYWLIAIAVICLLATTRGKAFGLLASYMALQIFLNRSRVVRLTKKSIFIIVLLALVFGYFQIEKYFGDENTPRAMLLAFGFVTANKYFPLGAGFGAYGSNMARVHYSPLYDQYGFTHMYGMGEDTEEVSFLNDNFWPMIMGQYGWFGVVLYLLIIFMIFKLVSTLRDKNIQIAGYLLFFSLVFSSSAGCVFVHYLGSAHMAMLAFIIVAYNKMKYL